MFKYSIPLDNGPRPKLAMAFRAVNLNLFYSSLLKALEGGALKATVNFGCLPFPVYSHLIPIKLIQFNIN
jgi:hypothetical protein